MSGEARFVRSCRHDAGFTLLEMLVVLAIMGLVAGLGFPALDRTIKAQAFRTATVQVELAVRGAQADAIRLHRTIDLTPFRNGDRRGEIAFARGLFASDLQFVQSNELRFYGDGTSTGGTIVITSGKRRFRLEINPETGLIKTGNA
jgi:general secretion pathway protein H